MTIQTIAYYQRRAHQMGRWMAVRWMRNRGVPFAHAYFVLFNREPRRFPV